MVSWAHRFISIHPVPKAFHLVTVAIPRPSLRNKAHLLIKTWVPVVDTLSLPNCFYLPSLPVGYAVQYTACILAFGLIVHPDTLPKQVELCALMAFSPM